MKLIIVTPYFYPHAGGVEVYSYNIARRLQARGWQVVVVTTGDSEADTPPDLAGMKVYYLAPALKVSNTPIGIRWRSRLSEIYAKEEPDLINAHTPVPFISDVAQRASGRIPFVLTYHNDLVKDSLVYRIIAGAAYPTLINRTLRRSTHVIATSEYYANESSHLRRYKRKLSVVSPGVDLTRFRPDVEIPDELVERYKGQRLILFVGSLNKTHRHKGLDVLISAFATIRSDCPDVSLVVVGSGNALEEYRSAASAAGVTEGVEFTGYLDDQTLAQYYKLAAVFAMPSTNRSEGFGMAFIEAGAARTPVIGTRVGGVPFAVLDDQTGLLVSPRSIPETASALRRLLTDNALAERLGAAGFARATAEFGWNALAERTHEIFMGLL